MNNRYSRQELFSPIGEEGQQKIREKHVLIIGAGALGSANAEMFVRAGVGTVTIVDRDYVDWSNLQRQQLYAESDVENNLPKAVAAKKRLEEINSEVRVEALVQDVTAEELEELVTNVNVMIDATDNFETRFIVNDIAQKYSIPWIYGACVGSYGLSYTILPSKTPCLSCLLQSIPLGGATCDTAGIISPAVSLVVSHQVTEALKLLVEDYESLRDGLVSFDMWKNEYSCMNVQKLRQHNCPSCGENALYPYLNKENTSKTAVLCGRNTVQIRPPHKEEMNFEQYKELLEGRVNDLNVNPYLLSFSVEDKRLVAFKDGRVLVHGTKDISEAKTIYHRYFG
ncbi:thiazole biosynthesis adenylyltransferase ThiF [Bacillus thuringiensis]|uniref:Thiazole biosynthesis adenylyltransferase ThiF n=1 Tax=Bacillus thuringiensis serovar toumanoffi TaxID=180862 RepID=A0ABD5HUW3_BACTU|nr:thiazole biosynthesis adenylyltransferase ThiF [Bacillus thuringiensis]MCR6778702.1 thiazole biosynthesis adenylyltransferase ThiF [Bacillus thuringiensis]MCR6856770.1 thiazole biosynthesis adenylyltransferase ThiF [Bacillus thuringiensis]MCR6868015.1 thiazole biosynthesis adenylyltransferase ThiF [Bacillus thuringiensis]MDW9208705.1 thiazole biosynthesis adenylyltransferase ThiF [Bacillus thuringiensis serovar toumanoffi]MED2622390.1 thiazole biosynthesis adenylyltransferase ThiF [Bacillus